MSKKYYVEFYDKESENQYFMQSDFFDTQKEAEKWFEEFRKNMSYIDSNIIVCLMSADWNDEGDNYEDIDFVKELEKDSL